MGTIQKFTDEYHIGWTRGRDEKEPVQFSLYGPTESRFGIVSSRTPSERVMGRPRRTIHIIWKTESLWQEDDLMPFLGPERRHLHYLQNLDVTVNISHFHQLWNDALSWEVLSHDAHLPDLFP